ncbi:MAG TPA: aminopeptidase P N-terminal domain-containing protein [Chitinophagaceae bacterium]|jgi:Xaa-Pro aminopeptidase|nr:aminopeptidase P N-terminal domain-containing protein [Chitinophagaceae bacterium]
MLSISLRLRTALLLMLGALTLQGQAQKDLPKDYLTPEFHKGRREAARALMPENSVLVVFAAPVRNFANDVDYNFHQNPDLYYFTGYKEPHAVLFLFKEPQTGPDGSFTELFFVQKKDARAEQWTGRRLGAQGVKEKLGISHVYDGVQFKDFPLDLTRFSRVLFDHLPDDMRNENDPADLYDLVSQFRKKAAVPTTAELTLTNDVESFVGNVQAASFTQWKGHLKRKADADEAYRAHPAVTRILAMNDTTGLAQLRSEMQPSRFATQTYRTLTGALREIKTPEEMVLLRKAIEISCMGQNEVMKTVHGEMSEMEIQGLHEYIHKKYGAEGVGYGSIVGAGENGCILHYTENTRTRVGNEMLLMDVGAEYHGYTADVTRTIPADGKFSPEERAIYQLVYDAQEAAFKTLKDGSSWAAAGNAAKETIANGLLKLGIIKKKEDVGTYYPHGLGHHIGMDVHDRGTYGTLKKGMVLTVEPGIYIPENADCDKKWWGIAVRIEDDVLIREKDYELLSGFAPRSIEAIEKMIAEKSVLDGFKVPALQSAKKDF